MNRLYKDKYFLRVMLLIFISIFIIVNALTFSIYKLNKLLISEKHKVAKLESLKEIKNMDDYLNNTILLLKQYIEKDRVLKKISNKEKISNYEEVQLVRKLIDTQSMALNIDSIWVYDRSLDKLYSSSDENLIKAKEIVKKIEKNPKEDISTINNNFLNSYFFKIDDMGDLYLIINLDLNWLNKINSEYRDDLYLFNKENQELISISRLGTIEDNEDIKYLNQFNKSNFIIKNYNEEWDLISIDGKKYIGDYNTRAKKHIRRLNLIFILFSLIISNFLTKKIVYPILGISRLFQSPEEKQSEIFLSDNIGKIISEIKSLRGQVLKYSEKLKGEILKEIIRGNIKEENLFKVILDYNLDMRILEEIRLIYCKAPHTIFEDFKFSSLIYKVRIGEDWIFFISSVEDQELNRIIDKFYFTGFKHLVISKKLSNIGEAKPEYESIENTLKKSIFFPDGNIFYLEDELKEEPKYYRKLEEEIISSIKSSKGEDLEKNIIKFLNSYFNLEYEIFESYLMRLYFSILDNFSEYKIDTNLDFRVEKFREHISKSRNLNDIEEYILNLCKELNKLIEEDKSEKNLQIVNRALEYVSKNYKDKDLSVAEIAKKLNITNSYLNQLAKEEIGKSVSQYITDYRIKKSKEELLNTDKTIKDIAKEVGFNNDNYFYSVFRKQIGITPGKYRKQVAE